MEDWSDFPAAHSMDTRWFAIDRDGHVALMESGEGGAVPTDGASQDLGYTQTEQLISLLGAAPMPTAGMHASGPFGDFVMLGDADAIKKIAGSASKRDDGAVRAHFGFEVPAAGVFDKVKRILFERANPGSAFRRVHEAGACGGCVRDDRDDSEAMSVAERLGLFFYDGPAGIAEPYERAHVPEHPLDAARIGELAAKLPRFSGSFASQERLQPVEHWKEVAAWSAAYVGSDGIVRCVPGSEARYAKEYEQLREEFEDVEPPPSKSRP